MQKLNLAKIREESSSPIKDSRFVHEFWWLFKATNFTKKLKKTESRNFTVNGNNIATAYCDKRAEGSDRDEVQTRKNDPKSQKREKA